MCVCHRLRNFIGSQREMNEEVKNSIIDNIGETQRKLLSRKSISRIVCVCHRRRTLERSKAVMKIINLDRYTLSRNIKQSVHSFLGNSRLLHVNGCSCETDMNLNTRSGLPFRVKKKKHTNIEARQSTPKTQGSFFCI